MFDRECSGAIMWQLYNDRLIEAEEARLARLACAGSKRSSRLFARVRAWLRRERPTEPWAFQESSAGLETGSGLVL